MSVAGAGCLDSVISSAIMNRMMPPAVCSAASETPSWRSTGPPNRANSRMMTVAMSTALTAIAAPLGPRHIGGQRGQQHGGVDRADDGKEGGERGQRGFEHGAGRGLEGARRF